ncbi:hypothetical protein HMPREF2651_10320 [Corynebacterium sp. HMSC063A05]|uniref:hypothetical protein n=1 Tax=Corynebacterium TaxID=1716 RepID=UPI0006697647|nr:MULTISPECIES: hypothetical protein [Corynebacterium]MDU4704855.1 hypothetical protein [Corynebacterium sp.]MBC6807574.1 hypothetical protein [Corynebacterium sp. LK30]OFM83390.1 hypothetical protein HMPREF2651_10320 [Corynebacterium sp. HMSC063A05]OFN08567.1 hypothetical protein HMPREF2614_06020 [Corynebacterium sp. HMSC074C11]QQU96968.1 hypothetical protein I6I65_06020 [Corynebacterium amycolatum]
MINDMTEANHDALSRDEKKRESNDSSEGRTWGFTLNNPMFSVVSRFVKTTFFYFLGIALLWLLGYWFVTSGWAFGYGKGMGVKDAMGATSDNAGLISGIIALAALLTALASMEQRKQSDERTAFYNRLHWALDKLESADDSKREAAFDLANKVWNSRVNVEDADIMNAYNELMRGFNEKAEPKNTATPDDDEGAKKIAKEDEKQENPTRTVAFLGRTCSMRIQRRKGRKR